MLAAFAIADLESGAIIACVYHNQVNSHKLEPLLAVGAPESGESPRD